jgi:hypothetical protein
VGPVNPVAPSGPVGPVGPVGPTEPSGPVAPVAPVSPVGPIKLVFAPTHTPFAAITLVFPTVKPFLTTKFEFVAKVHYPRGYYYYFYI